jgi:hypothetical protein
MNFVSVLPLLIPVIGAVAILIGVGAICFPEKSSVMFGIPAAGAATSYVRATGMRDVFMGAVCLYLYFSNSFEAVGFVLFFIAAVSLVDFILVRKNGVKMASYGHASATVIAIVYGFALLHFL